MVKLSTNISNKGFYVNFKNANNSDLKVSDAYVGVWTGYVLVCKGFKIEESENLTFNFKTSFSY